MSEECNRCHKVKDIGSLWKLTKGWGGRRTGETVCLSCLKPGETGDSACD